MRLRQVQLGTVKTISNYFDTHIPYLNQPEQNQLFVGFAKRLLVNLEQYQKYGEIRMKYRDYIKGSP